MSEKSTNLQWYRIQIRARRAFDRIPLKEHQKIYLLTLLIGGFCGLAAVSFHLLLDFFQEHIIYSAAALQGWSRIPLVILIPAIGGLIAGAGLYFYAPEARGSGIPQIKKAFYLDSGRIPARVIPGKMLLAAFNIGTGASLGRDCFVAWASLCNFSQAASEPCSDWRGGGPRSRVQYPDRRGHFYIGRDPR